MRFIRARTPEAQHPPAEQTVLDKGKDLSDQVITPEEFLDANREPLDQSTAVWNSIAKTVDFAADARILEKLQTNIVEYNRPEYTTAEKDGNPISYLSHEISAQDTSRLAAEAGLFLLVAARFYSRTEKNDIRAAARTGKELRSFNSPFIGKVLSETFPTVELAKRSTELIASLTKADAASEEVLRALVDEVKQRPELAKEFAAHSKNGSYDSPLCEELKRMIAIDWRHPDRQQSILHTFLQGIKETPDYFLEAFIRKVGENEQNRRYTQIRDMASFALANQGIDAPDSTRIQGVLRDTFSK